MTTRRVLSVGQCDPDHGNIRRALQSAFAAEVTGCASAGEALEHLRGGGFDLVLVNRIFDIDGDSGLDLIRRLKADPELQAVPVMLVSNFEDAQAQAVAAGAAPGFGKSALHAAPTLERLRPYLGG
jgi:CheY-like chemotaxis protein